MAFDIVYPKITAQTGEGKIEQIKGYLFSLADQLKWALNSLDSGVVNLTNTQGGKAVTTADEAKASASFNSVKSIIIKSADIVEECYDALTEKFSGQYVAHSDFGTFMELTEQMVTTNSTGITQLFESMQKLFTDIENLEHSLIEVNANIRSGLLYYDDDGVPIYGLEIGQRNDVDGVEVFNKYARFVADKLSFYDKNDTEVAYISDYKLYITNAQITGTLNLGRYELDPTDGLAFKWV